MGKPQPDPILARFRAALDEKARKLLADAETMLGVGLNEAAGRNAYLASFHAAQPLLFGSLGKAPGLNSRTSGL